MNLMSGHINSTRTSAGRERCRLGIIVPCHNEEEVVESTVAALVSLLSGMRKSGQADDGSGIVLVDDGSTDATWRIISLMASLYEEVRGIRLAARCGHQNAIIAALGRVSQEYDATVTIDADLQDDPEVIPQMVRDFLEGAEVVYGVRSSRDSDTWFKRVSAQCFYKCMGHLGVKTVYNHSDFRLLGREAASRLLSYGERNMYLRGVAPLLGGKQTRVYYVRRARMAGKSKYDFPKMVNFAVDGITSFSVKPVRLIFSVGLLFMLVSLGVLVYVLIRHFGGYTIEGWTSLMLSIWFCTGIVLMALGVIGEYIGKIYSEVKHRPRFFIESDTAASSSAEHPESHGFPDSADPVADICSALHSSRPGTPAGMDNHAKRP